MDREGLEMAVALLKEVVDTFEDCGLPLFAQAADNLAIEVEEHILDAEEGEPE